MKRNLPSSLLLALLVLLGVGLLYAAQEYLLDSTKKTAQERIQEIRDTKAKADKAHMLTRSLGSLEEQELEINSHWLKKENIVSYLGMLESSGSALGSQVEVVSVSEVPQALHPRVNVSLLVSGSFDSVMRTIGVLENSSYDTVITGATLDRYVSEKGATTWTAATVLSVALERGATTTPKKP